MDSMTGSLENKRKEIEEKKAVTKVTKKKESTKSNHCDEYEESQYDTITEEEIRKIKDNTFSVRMPDLSKVLPEDHFVNVYTKYASDITDGYYEYQVINAFWLLSAMTKSCVYTELKIGTYTTNLWIMIIGKSTTSRKTKSIGIARELYNKLFDISLPDTDYSLEGYLRELEDNCGLLDSVRDEVGGLLAKYNKNYNEGIFDIECKVYDGDRVSKKLKNADDDIDIEKPCTTKLYGTTLIRFMQNIDMDKIASGYGYRFLYVYPNYKKKRKSIEKKTKEDDYKFNVVLERARMIKVKITDPLMGGGYKYLDIEPDALKYFDDKMNKLEEEYENDDIIGSLIGRYQIYTIKLAMLIELGKKEISYNVTLDSMKIAVDLIENYFIQTFKSVIECKCEDIKNNNIEKVLSELKSLDNVAQKELLMRRTSLSLRIFNEVIATLIESNSIYIKIDEKTGKIYYILKTDEDREKEEKNLIKDKENILNKLRKKGNSSEWSIILRNTHLDKIRFYKAIDSLIFEKKIEAQEDRTNTDKPKKIISIIN